MTAPAAREAMNRRVAWWGRAAAVVVVVVLVPMLGVGCARQVAPHPADTALPCRQVRGGGDAVGMPALEWLAPASGEQQRRLDVWCATVGPAVVHRASDASPGRPVTRLAVVTWNMHVGAGNLIRLVRELRTGIHTSGQAPDALVLLLQETRRAGADVPARLTAGGPVPRRIAPWRAGAPPPDIVQLAQRLDLHLFYVPAMRNGRGRTLPGRDDRGSAILSSLPLTDLQAIELPLERQRRVVLAASVSGTTRTRRPWHMRLLNVHLENRPGHGRLWIRAAAARARQAETLRGALPPRGEVVLGGDLNIWRGPGERAMQVLHDPLDPWPREDRRPTFGARLRLDYLYARLPPGVTTRHRRLDDRYGSDHAPVLGEIDWSASTAQEHP